MSKVNTLYSFGGWSGYHVVVKEATKEKAGLIIQITDAADFTQQKDWAGFKRVTLLTSFNTSNLKADNIKVFTNDIFIHNLTMALVDNLGQEISDFLLYEDILSKIDPDKLEWLTSLTPGSTTPFVAVALNPMEYPEQLKAWSIVKGLEYRSPELRKVVAAYLRTRPTFDDVPREWMEHYLQMLTEVGNSPRINDVTKFINEI